MRDLDKKPIEEELIEEEDTSGDDNMTISKPFNPNDLEIDTPPFSIGFLIDKLDHNEINMNPEFQRERDLWSAVQQSRLIESILLGLPLPSFYFDTTTGKEWDVIDGLQRCSSIENFCVKKTLKLTGLEFLGHKDGKPNLEGKGFDDLDRVLQRSIITRPITIHLVRKADKSIRFILFQRLNTGGLILTAQEIRNAVYQGKPAKTVKQLASLEEFKKATDYRVSTKRMQDRDFVSRFIAFYLIDYRDYKHSLEVFINTSMEKIVSSNTKKMEEDFKKALRLSYKIFDNDAFRKRIDKEDGRKPINKAYFEVITVLFSKLSDEEAEKLLENRELLKDNLLELLRNEKYNKSLSAGTGRRDSVITRFAMFDSVLKRSIKGIKIKIDNDNEIKNC